ncbi:MAG TPA: C39 family peptidase [Patescibacteria group bacterium]|nr:C39 family peptidase [Patescibacteria group bacterium]
MPPIVRIYRKSIIIALSVMIIFGAGGFVFRGELRDLLDFKKITEQASLPKETAADEAQNQEEVIGEEANANIGIAADDSFEGSEQEVLGAATQKKPLPAEINLKIPFTSQAPHANWNLPYGEACEEASALMVHYFYKNKTFTKESADAEIKKLVDFQTKKYGFYKDSTADETARFIKDYLKYKKVRVLPATINAIKQELAAGRPVIIPAAGRLLGNPNFRQPGPLYHMLVVKGYTKDGKFITNDPGTRNGANYVYSQKVLMNAIHDWNGGDVNNGKKVIIVVDYDK